MDCGGCGFRQMRPGRAVLMLVLTFAAAAGCAGAPASGPAGPARTAQSVEESERNAGAYCDKARPTPDADHKWYCGVSRWRPEETDARREARDDALAQAAAELPDGGRIVSKKDQLEASRRSEDGERVKDTRELRTQSAFETPPTKVRCPDSKKPASVRDLEGRYKVYIPVLVPRSGCATVRVTGTEQHSGGSPPGAPESTTAGRAPLHVRIRPPVAAKLTLTSPKGAVLETANSYRDQRAWPGRWRVEVAAPGYDPAKREFSVLRGQPKTVEISLSHATGLSLEGSPGSTKITVKGPGRFLERANLPWQRVGLEPGRYSVSASATGYQTWQSDVVVHERQMTSVRVALNRRGLYGVMWVPISNGLEMTQTEVTVAQYRQCVDDGDCDTGNVWRHGGRLSKNCNYKGQKTRRDHPLNCVDWDDASDFCVAVHGRLPTYDEWTVAAQDRGSRKYPWGDEAPTCELAVMNAGAGDGCGAGSTQPACSRSPSGDSLEGLCDLAGNVREWTVVSTDGSSLTHWPIGGGWRDDSAELRRFAEYSRQKPRRRSQDIGFRCVRDASE